MIYFERANIDETAAPYTAMRAKSVLGPLSGNTIELTGATTPFGPCVGPCDIGFMAKVNSTTADVAVEFEIHLVQE